MPRLRAPAGTARVLREALQAIEWTTSATFIVRHGARRLCFNAAARAAFPLSLCESGVEASIVRAGDLGDVPAIYREMQSDASLVSQIAQLLPVLVYTVRPSG